MKRGGAWLWLAFLAVVAGYLAIRLAGGIALDSNILSLLPSLNRGTDTQTVQNRITENFSRRVIFLVGSPSLKTSAAAAKVLSATLERSGTISSLTSQVDPGAEQRIAAAYYPFRAGLLSPSDRARLLAGDGRPLASRALAILYGPGGFANTRLIAHDPFLLLPAFLGSLPTPQSRLQLSDGVFSLRDGRTSYVLVSANLAGDPFSMAFQTRFEHATSNAIAAMTAKSPDLSVLRTGAIFYAADSAREAMNETSIIGFISIAGTLLLIFLVFHGLRPLLLGLMAIAAGVLCAFVGTLLLFGQIHVVALLFGSSLIGISIDYSFEYFCEYFAPEAHTPQERLAQVLPAIGMGLGTTLIGYCTLLLAPFPGLQQVACFSLIGLSASFLTVVLCFPVLDATESPRHGARALQLARVHWTLWEAPRLRWLRIAILATCAIGAVAGMIVLHVDDNVRHLQSLSPKLRQQESAIERLTGAPAGAQFLIVEGDSEQALLRKEERLEPGLARAVKGGRLGGYMAMSQFVPSIARQTDNRRLVEQQLMATQLVAYLKEIGFSGKIDDRAPTGFLTPSGLPSVGPLSALQLLDTNVAGHPVHIVLLQGVKDMAAMAKLAAGVPGVHLVSPADDWSQLFGLYRRYALALLALSAVLMYPLLVWRYGLVRGLRVLAPPLGAVALAALFSALAGVAFTFFNAMALVLVLSIGVDYSVFCIETTQARKPVTSLAVALASLTTILSFGMLAFSRVFAVHAFGTTMLIGIFLAFLFAPATRNVGRTAREGEVA